MPKGDSRRRATHPTRTSRTTVVTPELLEAHHHEVPHLGEGERDHDERDARRAQTHPTGQQRHQRTYRHGQPEVQPAVVEAEVRRQSHAVQTQPQVESVPKTDHAAKAQRDVQRHRSNGIDQYAATERKVKASVGLTDQQRKCGQKQHQAQLRPGSLRSHERLRCAGHSPLGRQASTMAMSRKTNIDDRAGPAALATSWSATCRSSSVR